MILVFFGTKNYLSLKNEQENYKNLESKSKNKFETDKKMSENESTFSGQKIFTYSSDFYDIEKADGSIITKYELTYHTFDFNKKTVTQNSVLNGKQINVTYPFSGMYEEKGLVATTYVLTVRTLGLKEIWWSPDVPNLGYDFDDGTRIACYDLKIKTK